MLIVIETSAFKASGGMPSGPAALLAFRAETIPRVTGIQKNHRGKLCASKNHLVHLLGMH